ncbi:G-coupled receptor -like protein [Brachionus plicatilis]|uniref:G-coupled receptor-like protein n=1 Tax=Brachionus plicatilis TaxID=10195 RepID=A0A3M7RJR2_BRAPC|nr:G-coupled receptor -like protein [Brachionus plicatilis]
MKNSARLIFLIVFTKLLLINAKSTTNAIDHAQTQLVDKLMTLWYHVESIKSCGNNLQKLSIDLGPFWSFKFKEQIEKAVQLANIVNQYLSLSESSSFDLTFMSTLSHFMIDKNDAFLIGYGLVAENECIYVSREGNVSVIERSCYSLNFKSSSDSKSPYILENTNEIDEHTDCNNWYQNLKKLYSEYKFSANLNTNYKTYLDKLYENRNFSSGLFCGPIYECKNSKSDWVLLHTLPVFDREKNFKGSILIKLLVSKLNVNQCPDGDPIFKNTHKCKAYSDCVYTVTNQFSSGNYECHCQKGFINNQIRGNFFNGSLMEELYWKMKNQQNNSYLTQFNCLPCSDVDCCSHEEKLMDSIGPKTKNSDLDSYLSYYSVQSSLFWHCRKYNMPLRYTILTVQIVFVLITISLAILVFYSRHNKIIKHSMWVLLEIILFGAFLLYSSKFHSIQIHSKFWNLLKYAILRNFTLFKSPIA